MKKEQAIDELKKMRMHFRNLRWKESLPDAEKAIDMAIEALDSTIEAVPLEDYRIMEQTVYKLTQALAKAEPNNCEYWDSESHFCALRRPQAEPIKHGRWINEPNCWYRCSVCGEHYPSTRGYMTYHYCPACGARMMDEVEE